MSSRFNLNQDTYEIEYRKKDLILTCAAYNENVKVESMRVVLLQH